ncbi:MAG TPA: CehA/McbA family metallohydrolase [Vicinamibacterales bacterium]|nr:CehA/McbA family metallohydrolase [Vicinamibacterales bacterium]
MIRPLLLITSLSVLAAVALGVRPFGTPTVAAQSAALRWYKGNTHTHTLNSDGDSTPDEVARWYREHGYQFLVLTDHNHLTRVDGLNSILGADDQFLIVKGEEVSDRADGKPIHINGLDVSERVEPQHGSSVSAVIQANVDAIRHAGGIPHVNHPNFEWAISGDDLQRLEREKLFEIYNGHPQVNNLGGGGVPAMEEVWDRLLSSGKEIYGIADDDAHVFKQPGNPNVSGPGRGWVVVRAERLAPRPIVEALEHGNFYASTGVELRDYQVTGTSMTITIQEQSFSKYRVQFIGAGGRVLKEIASSPATYTFSSDERYVRAKILDSNGRVAWMQPVFRRGQSTSGK